MKQLSLIFLILASLNLSAQFSIAPQITINYSNFEVDYFGDFLREPEQKKFFPSFGLRLNYVFNRVLVSTDFNINLKNEFNLIHDDLEYDPPIFAKVSSKDINFSTSYNLIDNLFVGTGIKFLSYTNIQTKRGIYVERFLYTNYYAMLSASYIIKNISMELSISRYLSVIGKSDDKAFNELIRASEIFSLKVGYNISFNKRDSKG